jgi:hypothetical protein
VRAPNAQRSVAPAPVNVGSLPPQRSLSGDPNARLQGVLGEVRNEVPQR